MGPADTMAPTDTMAPATQPAMVPTFQPISIGDDDDGDAIENIKTSRVNGGTSRVRGRNGPNDDEDGREFNGDDDVFIWKDDDSEEDGRRGLEQYEQVEVQEGGEGRRRFVEQEGGRVEEERIENVEEERKLQSWNDPWNQPHWEYWGQREYGGGGPLPGPGSGGWSGSAPSWSNSKSSKLGKSKSRKKKCVPKYSWNSGWPRGGGGDKWGGGWRE